MWRARGGGFNGVLGRSVLGGGIGRGGGEGREGGLYIKAPPVCASERSSHRQHVRPRETATASTVRSARAGWHHRAVPNPGGGCVWS